MSAIQKANAKKLEAFSAKIGKSQEGVPIFWNYFLHPRLTSAYLHKKKNEHAIAMDEKGILEKKAMLQSNIIHAVLDPLSLKEPYKQLKWILDQVPSYERKVRGNFANILATGWDNYKVEKMLQIAGISGAFYKVEIQSTLKDSKLKMDILLFPAILQQLAELAFTKAYDPRKEPIFVKVGIRPDAPDVLDFHIYYRGIDPSNTNFFTILHDGTTTIKSVNPLPILMLAGEAMKCQVSAGKHKEGYFLQISHPLHEA